MKFPEPLSRLSASREKQATGVQLLCIDIINSSNSRKENGGSGRYENHRQTVRKRLAIAARLRRQMGARPAIWRRLSSWGHRNRLFEGCCGSFARKFAAAPRERGVIEMTPCSRGVIVGILVFRDSTRGCLSLWVMTEHSVTKKCKRYTEMGLLKNANVCTVAWGWSFLQCQP